MDFLFCVGKNCDPDQLASLEESLYGSPLVFKRNDIIFKVMRQVQWWIQMGFRGFAEIPL